MALATNPRSACRWTLEKICELIVSIALAVSAVCLLRGPLEPALTMWLGRILEKRIPNSDLEQEWSTDGIIVLGGSVRRVEAALEIIETFPNVPVILSGPGESEIQRAVTQLSYASERLIVDRRPTNTYQNAFHAREHMSANPSGCWILVTSAIHMPRALGTFQAMSLPVLPWPVYDTPSFPKLLSDPVWHEIKGLLAYRLLGLTHELLPSFKASKTTSTANSQAVC